MDYLKEHKLLILKLISLASGAILTTSLVFFTYTTVRNNNSKKNLLTSHAGKINVESEVESQTVEEEVPSVPFGTGSDIFESESSSNSGTSENNHVNIQQSIDFSSLNGTDMKIFEGDNFDPIKNLGLTATDKNGSNITNKIIIEHNSVNIYFPGYYSVNAYVILNDGSKLSRVFNVKVEETPLSVNVKNFDTSKKYLEKGEDFNVDLSLDLSKNYISANSVIINGLNYPLSKSKNLFSKSENYVIPLKGINEAGVKEIKISSIQMSDNSVVAVDKSFKVEVLKDKGYISDFNYNKVDNKNKVNVQFNLIDKDKSVKQSIILLYDSNNNVISSQTVFRDELNNLNIDLPKNGEYTFKVFTDLDLDTNELNHLTGEQNVFTKEEIFTKTFNIDTIDHSLLSGTDLIINLNDTFDPLKDLNLKATDVDGSDISNKIVIVSNDVDSTIFGLYTVNVMFTNSNNVTLEKSFSVTVNELITNNEYQQRSMFRAVSDYVQADEQLTQTPVAFSSQRGTVSGNDTSPIDTDVAINGTIRKSDGSLPSGKIEVELPTKMAFLVDQNGSLQTSNYLVTNKSSISLDLFIQDFVESNPSGGISIQDTTVASTDNRATINLALEGNIGKSSLSHRGIKTPVKVSTLLQNSTDSLILSGLAGTNADVTVDASGVAESFAIIFRIQKTP